MKTLAPGPFPLGPILLEAASDPAMRGRAAAILATNISDALMMGEREILGGSDAGECVRKLWAQLHGLAPRSFPPKVQFHKLDGGNLFGAWTAALLKVALEERGYLIHLEAEVATVGREGHIDIVIEPPGHAAWIVDVKWSPSYRTVDPPDEKRFWQILQAGWYATEMDAPDFSILTLSPLGMVEAQHDYSTFDYLADIEEESERLAHAYDEKMPDADVKEKFRCDSCAFRACEKNPAQRNAA